MSKNRRCHTKADGEVPDPSEKVNSLSLKGVLLKYLRGFRKGKIDSGGGLKGGAVT